jgi:CBS domain containing-hemolysin-like protein
MDTLLLITALITCSFIFSASEIALFSLSRVQLKKIKDQSEASFKKIRTLISDSFGLLITVLLFNEIVNITLGSIFTSHLIEPLALDPKAQIIVGVLITTPIILIFCELTPKVLATRINTLIVKMFLPIIYTLYLATKPISSVLRVFLPKQNTKDAHQLQEDDFIVLAEEQTETGHLHETELELIKNVFEMDDVNVEQVATPMKKLITIPSSYSLDQAAAMLLKDLPYSRIPISGKFKEDIVGVLNTKDLVEVRVRPDSKTESIMTLAKEPLIVSGNLSIDALFRKMKSKKVQVAFVKNAQNKIIGMISIQDILDSLIEEAFEE